MFLPANDVNNEHAGKCPVWVVPPLRLLPARALSRDSFRRRHRWAAELGAAAAHSGRALSPMEDEVRETAAGTCQCLLRAHFVPCAGDCDWQRLEFLRNTFEDLVQEKQRRYKRSLSSIKALDDLGAEKNNLRAKLQELECKRELQEQLFDKFMTTTRAQLELQLSDIETLECLAAASSSELVIRSMDIVQPIKNCLAQSMAELIFEMCAYYSSFTQDSTRNVYVL
jgi:hypothetical protein